MRTAILALVMMAVTACTPQAVHDYLMLHNIAVDEATATTLSDFYTPLGWVDLGHGVYGPEILTGIRWCESRDDYKAANKHSSARGGYQFLHSSWHSYGWADKYRVDSADQALPWEQDEAALLTWLRSGTSPWNASRHCWG